MNSNLASFARRRSLLFGALGLAPVLFAGTALVAGSSAQAQDEVTVFRTYKKGDVDRYKITFHTKINNPQLGGEAEVKLDAVLKETTKDVKDDGSGIIIDEMESALVKVGDMDIDATQFIPVSTQTRDKMGTVLDSKSEGGTPSPVGGSLDFTRLFTNAQHGIFPPKPTKVGDGWDINSDEKTKDGGEVKSTGKATLVAVEMIGDMKTYKIKTVVDSTIKTPKDKDAAAGADDAKPTKFHFEGVSNVDAATGKVIKMVGTANVELGPLGPTKLELSIALAGKDDKPAAK